MQIDISMNIKISSECLFLVVVGPITHQALQVNYHTAPMHDTGIKSVGAARCVINRMTSKKKHSELIM